MNITGGIITGNTGINGGAIYIEGTLTAKDATISGNTADKGGAIYVPKGNSATLTDCTVNENNSSAEGAAAIYLSSATLTLDGCKLTGNRVTSTGQNYTGSAIYSLGSSTITLKDTTITGNTHAGTDSGIRGAVFTSGASDKLILQGKVVIRDNLVATDGTAQEVNMFFQRKHNTAMDVGALAEGSDLSVYSHWGTETEPVFVKAATAPTNWNYTWITYDNNGQVVHHSVEKGFYFGKSTDHVHCRCGETECTLSGHKEVEYLPWTNAAALPTAGAYYLTVDVNLAEETGLTGDLDLCLNGHTVTAASGKQIITTPNNTDLLLTISDCTATYEDGAYKAGKLTGGTEKASLGRGGGAIYIRAEGDLVIYDGIFTGNTSGTGGGAIRLGKNATMVMYDGEISGNTAVNGTAYRTGGAISAITGTDVKILGGTIKNNKGTNGGAVYTEGKLTVGDCVISGNTTTANGGGVYVANGGSITLSGAPVIRNNLKDSAANNLYLVGNMTMTISDLDSKADVGVSAEKAFRAISAQCPDVSDRVTSDRAALQVIYKDSCLYLGAGEGHSHCLCAGVSAIGCDHKAVAFAAWDSASTLPASGNWYLTRDVELTASSTITEELNLCLNGYSIRLDKCPQGRMVYLKGQGKLTITDCTENPGTISGAAVSAVQFENNQSSAPVFDLFNGIFTDNTCTYGGGAVLVQGSGTFNMYGGIMTGNYIHAVAKVDASGNPVVNSSGVQQVSGNLGGGAICSYGTKTTINIYGGIITDNEAIACQRLNTSGKEETVGGTGGAIYNEGTLNIYGGVIADNKAYSGGAVFTATRTKLIVTGGEIKNNTAETAGGAIYGLRGEMTLTGGSITGNVTTSGGGVYAKGVVLVLDGITITGNTGTKYGGGVYAAQDIWSGKQNPNKVTFTSGTISGNSSATGGGFLLEGNGSEMVMTGGEISGNTASGTGGGIYVSTNTTFTMEGGKIAKNKASTGGGMRVYKCTATLKGGSVTGNTATSNAGGIYATYQETTLNLQGAEISYNTGNQAGGVLVENRATMNFSSGTVKGNTAKAGGGGIYVSTNSFLTMTGGSVTGNSATSGGGVYCYRGNLTLAGGGLNYNTAKAGGGAAQASGGTVILKGTDMIGNKVENGYGGGIRATGATVKQNGVTTVYPSTTTMYAGTISGNSSKGGGGVLVEQTGSVWTMYGGSVSNNTSTNSGGGFYVSNKTKLNLLGGKVNNNVSTSSGAGVYHLNSSGVYKNCELSGNDGRNGTITSGKNCTVELENVTANDNVVLRYGTVVYVETLGTATVKGCSFAGNSAGMTGGTLFSNFGGKITVSDTVFTGNSAAKRGGAVCVMDNVTIDNCVFTGNSAIYGGAIYSGDESQRVACNGWGIDGIRTGLWVSNCEFKDNVATENGGAMYMFMSCYSNVKNSTFTGNEAPQGSALWTMENLNMQDLIITGNKARGEGYAVYLAEAEYDGHSYVKGLMKISGDMLITDNEGGDLYLAKETTLGISSEGLGKNAKFGVTLDSGLLTQRVFGSYDYEGGDCVYLVTYGDRSLTDPEYDPAMLVKAEAGEDTQKTQAGTDVLLYAGIGVVGLAAIAGAVLLITKKKKSAAVETK